MATLVRPGWKDAAIEKSVVITDCWEVFKIYTGRLAEWILFGCMIFNIVEMIPGMNLWPVLTNSVMVITILTLDIAGFGLNSMANYARECGHAEAAKEAGRVAKCLIGIMMVTLLLATSGLLFPMIKPYLVYGEDTLILVRVLLVVIYGHTIHKLRQITAAQTPPSGALEEIARLQQALEHASATAGEALRSHKEELARIEQTTQTFQARALSEAQEWQARIATLEGQIQEWQQAQIASENAQTAGNIQVTEEAETGQDDGRESGQTGAQNITLLRATRQAKQQAKGGQTSARTKAAKASRCLARTPEMTAVELARKADIDISYARKLLSEHRAKSVVNE